ncbi:hypothetical protein LX36DRAFT_132698 [Colletotrichum falcatum]|nr:hypothetical protein LX36DRAFT_132698 [Colletotrichum falcatum]
MRPRCRGHGAFSVHYSNVCACQSRGQWVKPTLCWHKKKRKKKSTNCLNFSSQMPTPRCPLLGLQECYPVRTRQTATHPHAWTAAGGFYSMNPLRSLRDPIGFSKHWVEFPLPYRRACLLITSQGRRAPGCWLLVIDTKRLRSRVELGGGSPN